MINVFNKNLAQTRVGGKIIYFNKDTGEVEIEVTERPLPKVRQYKVVGQDTKWLSECVTKDDFWETLTAMDSRVSGKPTVNKSLLLEMVMEGVLTNKELLTLHHLVNFVVGHNYVVGNVWELREVKDLLPNHFSRVLAQLEGKRILKITRKDCPYRGDHVIEVAPHLVWDGDIKMQHQSINRWNLAGVVRK